MWLFYLIYINPVYIRQVRYNSNNTKTRLYTSKIYIYKERYIE